MSEVFKAAIQFAVDNAGLITTSEALALGVTQRMLTSRVESGVLVRLEHGLYSLPGTATTETADLAAACRKLGAVVSHHSAARHHGLSGIPYSPPTVTVPYRHSKSFPGVRVHQSTDIDPSHLMAFAGVHMTIPARTIVDLAAVLHPKRLEAIVDNGLAATVFTLDELGHTFSELARRGKPGVAALRGIIDGRSGEYVAPESELERRLIEIVEQGGFPEPVRQFKPKWLAPTNGRVDLAYPDKRLVIEGDSRRWHLLEGAFQIDRERDRKAQLAGWRVLRFSWREIVDTPDIVETDIRRALHMGTRGVF